MYSLNDLIASGCWEMEEEKTQDRQRCSMAKRDETLVKRENTRPFSNAINNQFSMYGLPLQSCFHVDLLRSIQRTNVAGSLSEGFHEDVFSPPVEPSQRDRWRRRWTAQDGQRQMDRHLSENVNAHTAEYKMDERISYDDNDAASKQGYSRPTIPPYSMDTHTQMQNLKMRGPQDNISQVAYKPIPVYNWSNRPQEYHGLHPSQILTSDNVETNGHTCPSNCRCVCHIKHTNNCCDKSANFQEVQDRQGVIMVPVSHDRTSLSMVTHVPLQVQSGDHFTQPLTPFLDEVTQNRMTVEDSFSDNEETYFRVNIDKAKARFKLSKEDWEKIPIKTFRSGGRLLGGEWTRIFGFKVKQSNPWCSLRFKNNHVRCENSRKLHSAPFFRGAAECKRPECRVKLLFVIEDEKGKYVDVKYVGNVCHKISD